jgi:anti-anti-sigma factor
MATPRQAFTVTQHGKAVCLSILRGAATPANLSEFGAAMADAIAKAERACIVVDLTEVEFMPTAMLGHLITASTKLRGKGGRIRLVGANSHIAGVFDVTRMKDHFDFHSTVESAVSSFKGSDAA